jgi:hypothetical protein
MQIKICIISLRNLYINTYIKISERAISILDEGYVVHPCYIFCILLSFILSLPRAGFFDDHVQENPLVMA